jgi:integrase
VLRRNKAANGDRMLEPDQLKKLIDAAPVPMKAMILLGLNAGLGNTDCAALHESAVNLAAWWLTYPRPKTGIKRRAALWPETVAALREAIASRPKPASDDYAGLVFLNPAGKPWVAVGEYRQDYVAYHFAKLLKAAGLHRDRVGFYTLRHVFRTVADECRDTPAVDLVMGHGDHTMAAHYRERISDDRLRAVADHVHAWLLGK